MVWQLSNFAEQFVVRSVTQFVKVLKILRAVTETPSTPRTSAGRWQLPSHWLSAPHDQNGSTVSQQDGRPPLVNPVLFGSTVNHGRYSTDHPSSAKTQTPCYAQACFTRRTLSRVHNFRRKLPSARPTSFMPKPIRTSSRSTYSYMGKVLPPRSKGKYVRSVYGLYGMDPVAEMVGCKRLLLQPSFFQAGCPSCRAANSVTALKE